MTINEFIDNLGKMPRSLRRECRKFLHSDKFDTCEYCPITAVAFYTTGKKFGTLNSGHAAIIIKLSGPDACKIIDAADYNKHYTTCPTKSMITLRARMLSALGKD